MSECIIWAIDMVEVRGGRNYNEKIRIKLKKKKKHTIRPKQHIRMHHLGHGHDGSERWW